jgi:catechol 2,3-dioxygenase-like lactoylglutathione lyase family enzyme
VRCRPLASAEHIQRPSGDDGLVIDVTRMNTILYTDRWSDTVRFYRDTLGLPAVFENDWFVELRVAPDTFVSVADSARTSIAAGAGAGLTLSWQVADVGQLGAARARLIAAGVAVSDIQDRWGARVAYLVDPAGNRIELWAGAPGEVTMPAR